MLPQKSRLFLAAGAKDAAVSQWEREAIGERTRDALRHKRTSGERVGNIRFGFRLSLDGKHVEPDPGEQGVLTEIRHLRQSGHTMGGDCGRPQPESAANAPWFRLAAGARGANYQAGNRAPPIRKVGGAICISGNPIWSGIPL
jgi:hypothetical protein